MNTYKCGDVVVINNRKNSSEKYYKQLPDTVEGIVFEMPFPQASKLKIKIEGQTNSRSSKGIFYFPLKEVKLKSDLEIVKWEQVKELLYKYYKQQPDIVSVATVYEDVKQLNKNFFTRKSAACVKND